jgi:hypothetical protein
MTETVKTAQAPMSNHPLYLRGRITVNPPRRFEIGSQSADSLSLKDYFG